MALQLSLNQWLDAVWARGIFPVSQSLWFRQNNTTQEHSLLCIGDGTQEFALNNIQSTDDDGYGLRAISFIPFAQAQTPRITNTTTFYHVFVRWLETSIQISINGGAFVNTAWSASDAEPPTIRIGNIISDSISSPTSGAIEHVCIWEAALSDANRTALYEQTVNPASIETASIFSYMPLVDSLTPAVGQAFTPINLASPTYETSGVSYPPLGGDTWTVTYDANEATGGSVPVDANSPYDDSATVTVLGNTGSLVRTNYTFNNWNTAANGSGTAYAPSDTFSISADTVLYAQWTPDAPPDTYTVTYNANFADSGTVPQDENSPYTDGATVTVLGNTGNLVLADHTFAGWNTVADGSGTDYVANDTFTISADVNLYAQWDAVPPVGSGTTIDHTNFDPTSRTDEEITAAASLDVFFAHASVGGYMVGPTPTWPYDGLTALATENARYTSGRVTWETPTAPVPAWYASNNGLGDFYYGNDGYAAKIADFRARLAADSRALANAVDVAMMKFCYIDAPDVSIWDTGYSAQTLFEAYRDGMLAEMALSPTLNYVWWTMPLEVTGSAGRQTFNELVRAYCTEHDYWLFDIADIECHNELGVKQLDGTSEILASDYANDEWGHPNALGSLKLARAYWSLLAYIANGEPTPPVDLMTITTEGATFSPLLTVTGTPAILWTFADDTTSDSATPTKDYGTAAQRTCTLSVTPWSAVTGLNFGYDGSDGGSGDITLHAQQNVSAIAGLELVADSLEVFCASNNPDLATLDFTDFTALHTIECFTAASLASVTVAGCTSLARICLEACSIPTLDLTGLSALEDLRYADNGSTLLTLPAAANSLWHICIRDNPLIDLTMTYTYPALREYWAWNCGLTGTLSITATQISSVWVAQNGLTGFSYTGGMPNNVEFNLNGSALDTASVNALLLAADATEAINGDIDIAGGTNAYPTETESVASLTLKGWDIIANAAPVPTFRLYYNGNGSTGGTAPVDLTGYESGELAPVVGNTGGLTRTGHSFAGWAYDVGGTLPVGETVEMLADTTIYAVWVPGVYGISYNDNGATGGTVPIDGGAYEYNTPALVLGNVGFLERTNYIFVGWRLSPAAGAIYIEGDSIIVTQEMVLYACWIPKNGAFGGGSTGVFSASIWG